jgi:anti-sigma factor RsiW
LNMSCDYTDQVHQYHDGELPAGERDALEAHLKSCADCQTMLGELRAMSRMLAAATMAQIDEAAMQRIRNARYVLPDTGVLKIAGWLTAAAAAVLLAALPVWRQDQFHVQPPSANATVIDPIEMTAPSDSEVGRNDVVALAQWMSDDLSGNERH